MIFGSHLYGTDTHESDKDFKSVFLPTKEQIYLEKVPKSIVNNTKKSSDSKNTTKDIDTEIYSLHYFIQLACEGQTVALDMLHCPDDLLLETSGVWIKIVQNRHLFYTKNLDAFVGYARKQAAKYGIKGSRLNNTKRVIDFLKKYQNEGLRLLDIWDKLPEGEHIHKHEEDQPNNIKMFEVCGRKVQETSAIEYVIPIFEKFYRAYGDRAIKAARNEGIDWKAVSHAFRAAYQVKDILTKGTIIFPLAEADFLKEVKAGRLHYQDIVAPALDGLMDEIEELSKKSTLPKKVNRKYWDNFLIKTIEEWII